MGNIAGIQARIFIISCTILLVSISLFVFADSYAALVMPFAILFLPFIILNWKAVYWIQLFSIPFSVTVDIVPDFISTTIPDEPITWMFTILVMLLIAHNPRIFPRWGAENTITLIVFLQLVWLVVAVAFSSVFWLSLKFLVAKIWMLAVFFVVPVLIFKQKRDFTRGFVLLLISILVTAIVVLSRQSIHDFRFTEVNKACSIFYYNHVEYAAVLATFLPLMFVSFKLAVTTKLRLLVLLVITILLTAIILSFARSAILALLFAVAISIAIRMKLANIILPVMYGLAIMFTIYLVQDYNYIKYRPNYDQTYMRTNYGKHLEATIRGQDLSTMERVYRWVAAARMSTVHPVTGFGPHSFIYHYKTYTAPEFKTYVSANSERSTTHNYFLYVLTEQGWVAMFLYALLYIVIFAQAQSTYHRLKDRFYKACTLGVAMMLAAGFINNMFSELIETHKAGALFYLPLALLVVLKHKSFTEMQYKE